MVDSAIFKDALEKILAFCHTMLKLKCPIFVQKSDFDSKSAKNLIKIWTFGRVCGLEEPGTQVRSSTSFKISRSVDEYLKRGHECMPPW